MEINGLLRHTSTGQGYLSDAASIFLSQRPISLFNHAALSALSVSKTWPLSSPQNRANPFNLEFCLCPFSWLRIYQTGKINQNGEGDFETVGLVGQGPMIAILLLF